MLTDDDIRKARLHEAEKTERAMRKLVEDERRSNVARLYRNGKRPSQIAEILNIDTQTVRYDLMLLERARRRLYADSAQRRKERQAEQIEAVRAKAWEDGNLMAVLKSMDREAKLFGLDAREQLDVTSGGEPTAIVFLNDWRSRGASAATTSGGREDFAPSGTAQVDSGGQAVAQDDQPLALPGSDGSGESP
jgi:DNA-binding CsgD family transcriptional regulator